MIRNHVTSCDSALTELESLCWETLPSKTLAVKCSRERQPSSAKFDHFPAREGKCTG